MNIGPFNHVFLIIFLLKERGKPARQAERKRGKPARRLKIEIFSNHKSMDLDDTKKIGKGGYSKVYSDGEKAIKRLRDDSEYFSSLVAELSALGTLRGKSGILDIGDISLAKVEFSMKRFPLTLSSDELNTTSINAKQILFQLLLSLYHAHSAGIVHGDIKPQNILIDNTSAIVVALIDWGISKFPWSSFTQSESEIQTKGYKSPENMRKYIIGIPISDNFVIDFGNTVIVILK